MAKKSGDVQSICVFEDEGYEGLLPLTFMRPTWGLRCGMTVLLEKILRAFSQRPFTLHCRSHLADTVRSAALASAINRIPDSESCLFINGRVLAGPDLAKKVSIREDDFVLQSGNSIVAAKLSEGKLEYLKRSMDHPLSMTDFEPLKLDVIFKETDIELINHPWDLVRNNKSQISADFSGLIKGGSVKGDVHSGVYIYDRDKVFIESDSEIMATAVLDARGGPIYIGRGAKVLPHSRIEGPAYIGDRTKVLGANIREGSSIGPLCKIGGEIEETVIQGYTNKQHYGFIGHSYICEWVNLGAGTTNSDLKNNYGSIRVWTGKGSVDTGLNFVGCFIGDHSKTGIGTLINTGSVVGVGCNVFGGGIQPKYIPSFSWGGESGMTEHRLEEAVETARVVMARRGVEMTSSDEMLLRKIFDDTRSDRTARASRAAANEI